MMDYGVVWGKMKGIFSCDVEEKVLKEKGFEIVEPVDVFNDISTWKTIYINYSKSVPVISRRSYSGDSGNYWGGEPSARHSMLRASQFSQREYAKRNRQ